ncbi:MAG TPA: SRPBCC domain-containing protein [Candidatus Binataceae bacterium]|nr:SRPBCC domain-containing protein [Candidatus Binataceae bacterium]
MTIRKSIRVERPPEIAFKVFCEEMSEWWPGGFGGKDSKPFMEQKVGGRLYERNPDGSEYEIGRVNEYQPPSTVAFTWRAPSWDVVTQVEIRFTAEGGGTRVELEHRGWEQDAKTREARSKYDGGWDFVLGHYQSHFKSNE